MSPQRYHLYLQHVVPDLYTPFLASVAIGVIGVFYGAAALSYNTVGGLIYPEGKLLRFTFIVSINDILIDSLFYSHLRRN